MTPDFGSNPNSGWRHFVVLIHRLIALASLVCETGGGDGMYGESMDEGMKRKNYFRSYIVNIRNNAPLPISGLVSGDPVLHQIKAQGRPAVAVVNWFHEMLTP